MKKKDKATAALLAVFPTNESLATFAADSNNASSLQSFMDYASRNELIEKADLKSMDAFIARNARSSDDCMPPSGLTFGELLEKKDELLNFSLSVRSLTDRINTLMDQNGIELPRVSNPMLTRLKMKPADTPYKQHTLRSLAFWIGHERAGLGPVWNFETLRKLCPQHKPVEQYRDGVRIGFALFSRGDIIDHSVVNWLKKAISQYIEHSFGETLHGHWGKVRSHDLTSLYVDIPKEAIAGDPAAYRSCLKNAVSLTHQVAIRWGLSKYCSHNRFLSIGIVAGEFATLDNYLIPILNTKLSGDPIIRVSDYVRQCLLISDIRVILCRQPSEASLFNGEALRIWWITAFWSFLYFDFVPDLLEDRILKNNPSTEETLPQLLWFPEEPDINPLERDEANAIATFFKFPQNSLLGIEIAKTLYYRRRFQEAVEILRIVLSIDPTDPTARTLRMALFRELALEASPYSASENFFRQAEHEALYILEECRAKSEDFYCEYAAVFSAKAALALRRLRQKNWEPDENPDLAAIKKIIRDSLDTANYFFEKAMTVSSTAIRSSYSLNTTAVMKAILESDETLFTAPDKPLDSKPAVVARPSADRLRQIRLTKEDLPKQHQHDLIENIFVKRFRIHDESISLRSFRPNVHFCHAVALWDFSLVRTVAIAKRVLKTLEQALDLAAMAAKDNVCVYASTRGHVEILPAEDFMQHMSRALDMVRAFAGEDIMKRDDREILTYPTDLSSCLMTLNF